MIAEKSNHYKNQRYIRENFIKKHLNGDGKVIDSFVIDRGHEEGAEMHFITENGIIIIQNLATGKIITKLIGREWQIKRYYESTKRKPPPEYKMVLELARWHESLNYNRVGDKNEIIKWKRTCRQSKRRSKK